LLAGSISTLPVHTYREGEREPLATPPLLRQPAARTSLPDWLHQVMVSLLLRGNAFGIVTARSGATMLPAQVELVSPDQMAVRLGEDGRVEYRLGGRLVDDPADVWHLKGFSLPGSLEGLSPISYLRQGIGLAVAAEEYGARLFGSGSLMSGVLQTDQDVGETEAEALKARWREKVGGLGNAHEVAILDRGLKYQPISISPADSQLLDSRKFSVLEICRAFGVPPELVAADTGGSHTYRTTEQESLRFLKFGLAPWLVRLETAIGALLPARQYVKFSAGALLRTDLLTRYQSYKLALEGGWLTLDEVRALEDRPPLETAA
jgi:HK97 family phage portal protein